MFILAILGGSTFSIYVFAKMWKRFNAFFFKNYVTGLGIWLENLEKTKNIVTQSKESQAMWTVGRAFTLTETPAMATQSELANYVHLKG